MTLMSVLLTSVKWRQFQRNQIFFLNSSVSVLKMVMFHFSYGSNVNLTSNIIILHKFKTLRILSISIIIYI